MSMKKLLFVVLFIAVANIVCFAASDKGNAGSNGNGGADKIGAYIGWPVGLSYSHEFNELVELDLLFGYNGFYLIHNINLQLGALFTVFDPVLADLGNQKCPLSLGPVIGGAVRIVNSYYRDTYTDGSLYLLLPIRWEMNFGDIPDFNIFIDVAPVGVSLNFIKLTDENGKERIRTIAGYAFRAGVGLRYRIPNKK